MIKLRMAEGQGFQNLTETGKRATEPGNWLLLCELYVQVSPELLGAADTTK